MANKTLSLLFAVLLAQLSFALGNGSPAKQPTLYVMTGKPNAAAVRAEEVNFLQTSECNIVIATHGWIEFTAWTKDLAIDISEKVDGNNWICGWFDWRDQSRVINPRDAAQYARDTAGKLLAEQILKISKKPHHIHLIGHSSGCWAINEAAKIISQKTDAEIHLTFLDAYVPIGWEADSLGNIPAEPNKIYWADHYLTEDISGSVTYCVLLHAHNVDIGNITPGLKDHRFPFFWYPATVLGKYDPNSKYADDKLYYKSGETEYGFARSLEAGKANWEKSIELKMGNEPVKLKKPPK